jgi:hypothetical protein
MFYVIDIRVNPQIKVEGTESNNIEDCINWISVNGDAVSYSIQESEL